MGSPSFHSLMFKKIQMNYSCNDVGFKVHLLVLQSPYQSLNLSVPFYSNTTPP